jgi:hypothetical protein
MATFILVSLQLVEPTSKMMIQYLGLGKCWAIR